MLPAVDPHAVAAVVADWTGIPLGRMVRDETQAVLKLADTLGERVVGQQHAVELIAERIQTARAKLDDPKKPHGVFLLCGPSGVGKTETALALADTLYGGEHNAITINMSEFQEAHTVSTLKGAPPGYVGYGQGGVLTEAVRRRPYSVVLLDEIEKAHRDVHEIFFQVFDKGWMEDGEGRDIDFRHTVILLTSNVGADRVMQLCRDPERLPDVQTLADALRAPLLDVFPAALLGRLTVVPYYPLTDATLARIVALQLRRIEQRIDAHHGIRLRCTEAATALVVERCRTIESGGRMVDAILTHTVMPRIGRAILQATLEGRTLSSIELSAADGEFRVPVRRGGNDLNRVFTLDTQHGDDLKFHTLDGSDELGRLFEFRIEALADSHSLSLKDMLGKPVTVRIEQQDLSTRYLNGIVARASLSGRRAERYYGYELIVRPWLWLATRRSDCRIFQNKTVPEIVQEVLSTYGFPIENHLAESYVPRDYCVQYNETDAAFVSRLMEFEGSTSGSGMRRTRIR